MTNITRPQTTTSSAFGMPACGRASAPAFATVAARYGVTRVPSQGQLSLRDGVKGRNAGIGTGAEATGTPAWRPPTE
jgi:hypothetical protein